MKFGLYGLLKLLLIISNTNANSYFLNPSVVINSFSLIVQSIAFKEYLFGINETR
jgi:hypothetical protein